MSNLLRPDSSHPSASRRAECLRTISNRLQVRSTSRRGVFAVPRGSLDDQPVPVVSPVPAALLNQPIEAHSLRTLGSEPTLEQALEPSEKARVVPNPEPLVSNLALPFASSEEEDFAANRPISLAEGLGATDRPARSELPRLPIGRSSAAASDQAPNGSFDHEPLDRSSVPAVSELARLPTVAAPDLSFQPGFVNDPAVADPVGSPLDRNDDLNAEQKLPRLRPGRPDALITSFASSEAASRPTSSNSIRSSVPTDEEIFADAASTVGGSGGGGGGPTSAGMDLSRTNELLQQLVDAVRKQAGGSSSALPAGGNLIYAERY